MILSAMGVSAFFSSVAGAAAVGAGASAAGAVFSSAFFALMVQNPQFSVFVSVHDLAGHDEWSLAVKLDTISTIIKLR
jgi:hypothetical protein